MGGNSKIKISKSKIFYFLSSSFLTGVFAASFFDVEKSILLILAAGGIAVFLIDFRNKKTWLFAGAVLMFIAGASRTSLALSRAEKKISGDRTGAIQLVGKIIQEPEISENYQKIIIKDEKRNKFLMNGDVYPSYDYGDIVAIKCSLEKPKNYPNSRFDYQMYLAKDGIFRICNKPQISIISKKQGGVAYALVISVKNRFEEKLSEIFPDPEGAYLKGLLLGGSKRMTEDLSEAFSKTGTTHTVAVSGYNVSIVAIFLMWLGIFIGLWRQQVFSFAVVGIVLFVLMTGAPSSAVRAGIMGSLVIWAMKEGRLANSASAILLAAAAMLAINPLLLRYDAGFQLSFLATLGIVYLSPVFEKYFEKIGKSNLIRETIFLSVAAQIFVLPIILADFEIISPISPLANLLILPAIPYIMFGGFAAALAGFIFVPLGMMVGFVPYMLLKSELAVVSWLATLPWASLEIKNFGWKYITIYYIVLAGLLVFYKRKSRIIPAVPPY